MRHFLKKKSLLFIICAVLTCILSFGAAAAEESAEITGNELKVTFVDVGKGDCILIQTDGQNILVDAGYVETAADVTAYFESQGIERLDYLIITHYDKDHVGGAADIVAAFEIGQIYLPDYEGVGKYYTAFIDAVSDLGLDTEIISEETVITISDAVITIYPSDIKYVHETWMEEGNDNDVSLVISLINDEDTYMFAGDLEVEGVEKYIAADHGQFDVLKVPHHGVKEDNTEDLINDVKPEIAVITDGEKDKADKKVVKKLTKTGAEVYQSSECGTIIITSSGTGEYEVITQE